MTDLTLWSSFTVTELAKRPVAPSATCCFYCGQQIGQKHMWECVLIKRKVRLRIIFSLPDPTLDVADWTFEFNTSCPASWEEEELLSRYNESTWCAGNAIRNLFEQKEITDEKLKELERIMGDKWDGFCLCPYSTVEVVSMNDDVFLEER